MGRTGSRGRITGALVSAAIAGFAAHAIAGEGAIADAVTIPVDATVAITVDAPLTSKDSKPGDTFPISVREPLRDAAGAIVLAPGSTGAGEVIHAAKAGFGGKAGELIMTARFIQCAGVRVPLGHFRFVAVGRDNAAVAGTTAAVASGASVFAPLAGVGSLAAFLIKGGQVRIPAGTPAEARVKTATLLTPEARVACGGMTGSTREKKQ